MKRLLITLALAAGLLTLLAGLRGPYARMAAKHLRRQLDSVSDDAAPWLLARAAELGETGIPVLVEALGSQHEQVARAGKRELLRQVDRWQMLPAQRSSPKLAVLADALADRVQQFGPTARADAGDLATRILRWPLDPDTVDRTEVTAACETVLRATKFGLDTPAKLGSARRRSMPIEQAGHGIGRPLEMHDLIEATGGSIAEMARLPGGGLPVDGFPSLHPQPDPAEVPYLADAGAQQPRRLPDTSDTSDPQPLGPLRRPDRLSIAPEDIGADLILPGYSGPRANRPSPPPIRPLSLLSTTEPAKIEAVDLMRRLHAADPHAADIAQAELLWRGFTTPHIELARQLFDPDPEIRKQLARSLPALPGVDAAPWLLWLSRDAIAGVRLQALMLMATTRDPAMLDQVEQMSRRDPDPHIRSQAERIAKRRRQQRLY